MKTTKINTHTYVYTRCFEEFNMYKNYRRIFISANMILLGYWLGFCQALQTNIVLDQGPVVGLKIFPDTSRSAIYAFLGLPYAQPPVGDLRFAPPQPSSGWNGTLQVMSMKPICPQPANTIYDETPDKLLSRTALTNEDCLYLNIWVPETGTRFSNLPVLVIITGEEMAFDWPRNRVTGVDLASEDIIVVSIQYRSNIIGWMGLENHELPGNYGLKDQELALLWIQHNIHHFGGNPRQITLLGHGTSGAPCAIAHLLAPSSKKNLFSKLILMSGGDIEAALDANVVVRKTSKVMVQKLGCQFEERRNQLVKCLRTKSLNDLLKAFESVYEHGNSTLHLGPIVSVKLETFLTNRSQIQPLPPLLIGIASNEGAFMQDYWLDLAHEGYQALRAYINYTVISNVLRKSLNRSEFVMPSKITDTLNWRYFIDETNISVSHLLNSMQRLISEAFYETPFYHTLELFTATNNTEATSSSLYAYIFDVSDSMDMRGKVNLFGGASHSSDLPFLLGPSMFQQIARRRFSTDEERLCRKVRAAFVNFIKSSNPTPGRIYDAWLPYHNERKFIFNLGGAVVRLNDGGGNLFRLSTVFERNLPQIKKLSVSGLSRSNRSENNPYHLGSEAFESQTMAENRVNTSSYLTNQQDSGYALHLKSVYGFWHVIIPNIGALETEVSYDGINNALRRRVRLLEVTADAIRYKQGFFAMLGFVAVLLAVLGLCIYLLRRDPLYPPARSTNFCL